MIDHDDVVLKCTICDGEYNPGTEGGRSGYIGILPVNFCPTCTAGIFDFAEQFSYEDIDEEQLRDNIVDYFNNNDKVCIKADEHYIVRCIHDLMSRAESCENRSDDRNGWGAPNW